MKKSIYLSFPLLLLILLSSCRKYTSLPTDTVGPQLSAETTPLTEWQDDSYRLLIDYEPEQNEALLLDVDEAVLYSWQPEFQPTSSLAGQETAVYYYIELIRTYPVKANFHALAISIDGSVARLPATYIDGGYFYIEGIGPWFSPDGQWQIKHGTIEYQLYKTSKDSFPEFSLGKTYGVSAWVVAWQPDSTRFIMSTKLNSFLIQIDGQESLLPGEAGQRSYDRGQWLADGRVALISEEKLYTLDLENGTLAEISGLGRVVWFAYSPDFHYLATIEKVDCRYVSTNSSWYPGEEKCVTDIFLYDANGENRQRLTTFDAGFYVRPVWLPLSETSPIWDSN